MGWLALPCLLSVLTYFDLPAHFCACSAPHNSCLAFVCHINAVSAVLLLCVCLLFLLDRLVRACSELPKLCEFYHIPFQSGDDEILRQMKRGYTAARYTSIIDNIRRYMPDASISGDAIVGFPGTPLSCVQTCNPGMHKACKILGPTSCIGQSHAALHIG